MRTPSIKSIKDLGVAQLVARYLGVVEAVGSSPVTQTIAKTPLRLEFMKLRFNGAFILHILHISILQYYYFFDII